MLVSRNSWGAETSDAVFVLCKTEIWSCVEEKRKLLMIRFCTCGYLNVLQNPQMSPEIDYYTQYCLNYWICNQYNPLSNSFWYCSTHVQKWTAFRTSGFLWNEFIETFSIALSSWLMSSSATFVRLRGKDLNENVNELCINSVHAAAIIASLCQDWTTVSILFNL
jgi:hypothetical protein